MAEKMATSGSHLDPNHVSIRPETLMKAARAVGKTVEIRIKNGRRTSHA